MANGNGNGNGKGFKGGGLATGITGMTAMAIFLLNQPTWVKSPDVVHLVVFLLDLFLKVSLAVVTGGFLWFSQILLNDYYNHNLKHRIFKNKKKDNDKMERDEQERVA